MNRLAVVRQRRSFCTPLEPINANIASAALGTPAPKRTPRDESLVVKNERERGDTQPDDVSPAQPDSDGHASLPGSPFDGPPTAHKTVAVLPKLRPTSLQSDHMLSIKAEGNPFLPAVPNMLHPVNAPLERRTSSPSSHAEYQREGQGAEDSSPLQRGGSRTLHPHSETHHPTPEFHETAMDASAVTPKTWLSAPQSRTQETTAAAAATVGRKIAHPPTIRKPQKRLRRTPMGHSPQQTASPSIELAETEAAKEGAVKGTMMSADGVALPDNEAAEPGREGAPYKETSLCFAQLSSCRPELPNSTQRVQPSSSANHPRSAAACDADDAQTTMQAGPSVGAAGVPSKKVFPMGLVSPSLMTDVDWVPPDLSSLPLAEYNLRETLEDARSTREWELHTPFSHSRSHTNRKKEDFTRQKDDEQEALGCNAQFHALHFLSPANTDIIASPPLSKAYLAVPDPLSNNASPEAHDNEQAVVTKQHHTSVEVRATAQGPEEWWSHHIVTNAAHSSLGSRAARETSSPEVCPFALLSCCPIGKHSFTEMRDGMTLHQHLLEVARYMQRMRSRQKDLESCVQAMQDQLRTQSLALHDAQEELKALTGNLTEVRLMCRADAKMCEDLGPPPSLRVKGEAFREKGGIHKPLPSDLSTLEPPVADENADVEAGDAQRGACKRCPAKLLCAAAEPRTDDENVSPSEMPCIPCTDRPRESGDDGLHLKQPVGCAPLAESRYAGALPQQLAELAAEQQRRPWAVLCSEEIAAVEKSLFGERGGFSWPTRCSSPQPLDSQRKRAGKAVETPNGATVQGGGGAGEAPQKRLPITASAPHLSDRDTATDGYSCSVAAQETSSALGSSQTESRPQAGACAMHSEVSGMSNVPLYHTLNASMSSISSPSFDLNDHEDDHYVGEMRKRLLSLTPTRKSLAAALGMLNDARAVVSPSRDSSPSATQVGVPATGGREDFLQTSPPSAPSLASVTYRPSEMAHVGSGAVKGGSPRLPATPTALAIVPSPAMLAKEREGSTPTAVGGDGPRMAMPLQRPPMVRKTDVAAGRGASATSPRKNVSCDRRTGSGSAYPAAVSDSTSAVPSPDFQGLLSTHAPEKVPGPALSVGEASRTPIAVSRCVPHEKANGELQSWVDGGERCPLLTGASASAALEAPQVKRELGGRERFAHAQSYRLEKEASRAPGEDPKVLRRCQTGSTGQQCVALSLPSHGESVLTLQEAQHKGATQHHPGLPPRR